MSNVNFRKFKFIPVPHTQRNRAKYLINSRKIDGKRFVWLSLHLNRGLWRINLRVNFLKNCRSLKSTKRKFSCEHFFSWYSSFASQLVRAWKLHVSRLRRVCIFIWRDYACKPGARSRNNIIKGCSFFSSAWSSKSTWCATSSVALWSSKLHNKR